MLVGKEYCTTNMYILPLCHTRAGSQGQRYLSTILDQRYLGIQKPKLVSWLGLLIISTVDVRLSIMVSVVSFN